MFAFRCVPSPLHPHIIFSARLPTNQVYQSLKLMNGPLVYNNERVVEERPILSVFAPAALDFFFWGGGGVGSLDCFVSSQSGQEGTFTTLSSPPLTSQQYANVQHPDEWVCFSTSFITITVAAERLPA